MRVRCQIRLTCWRRSFERWRGGCGVGERSFSGCRERGLPVSTLYCYGCRVLCVAILRAGRSFNGRTRGSGPRYRGSNPCLPANSLVFSSLVGWEADSGGRASRTLFIARPAPIPECQPTRSLFSSLVGWEADSGTSQLGCASLRMGTNPGVQPISLAFSSLVGWEADSGRSAWATRRESARIPASQPTTKLHPINHLQKQPSGAVVWRSRNETN